MGERRIAGGSPADWGMSAGRRPALRGRRMRSMVPPLSAAACAGRGFAA